MTAISAATTSSPDDVAQGDDIMPTTTGQYRVIVGAAAIPSALSLAWTAWSIGDMIPAPLPVALAAGVVLDLALIAAVAIAWHSPTIARPASIVSWSIASVAALAIGWHGWSISPAVALLATVPLISKGLWHLALGARRAAQQAQTKAEAEHAEKERRQVEEAARRARELSEDLTEEQERKLAEIRRQTAYIKAISEAELARDQAEAEAEQQRRLAEIKRLADQQMARDQAAADIEVRRVELGHRIRMATPVYTVTELPAAGGSGLRVPDDLSGLDASPASPADLRMPRPASSGASGDASPEEGCERLLAYVARQADAASVRGAAREMGVDPRTIRRYRDLLEADGHDMSVLRRTQSN